MKQGSGADATAGCKHPEVCRQDGRRLLREQCLFFNIFILFLARHEIFKVRP